MTICKICKSKTKKIVIYLPTFRHLDFKTIDEKISLRKCIKCQLIFRLGKKIKKISKIYKTNKYASSKQTNQKIIKKGIKKHKTRSYYQSEIIKKLFKKDDNLKILDIGCFDGKLINELSKKFKKSYYYGFDVNKQLKNLFPRRKNFCFINKINEINEKLDLIILSHSIMYIDNLKDTFLKIKSLLKKDGAIYIQHPNLIKNPFYILMGDQFQFFTEKSIMNMMSYFGFKSKIINTHFIRESIILAKKRKFGSKINYRNDNSFEISINKLAKMKKNLYKFSNKKIIVMGSTINAAFVHEILKKNVIFFTDEQLKNKNLFRNKAIVHPKKLKNDDEIILPYDKKNMALLNKFKSKYKGNFNLV
ncbi:MAG: hypothetical protein CFH22_00506 [Alphaproteobacteria bacterium MarineAlpha5_Bin12]|nr:MAG: hypothetical protein CFH22_00506 [Alphaproteobacteria bacterium MarineAlpha5_Bin12]|tara:strand:- start:7448 stop:8533 length:1086 start_codon:yes stop_codon:yes gene_type:complete